MKQSSDNAQINSSVKESEIRKIYKLLSVFVILTIFYKLMIQSASFRIKTLMLRWKKEIKTVIITVQVNDSCVI